MSSMDHKVQPKSFQPEGRGMKAHTAIDQNHTRIGKQSEKHQRIGREYQAVLLSICKDINTWAPN